ncbi:MULTISPECIES: carboxymuconolactone decarboxylase family protein [unclassified Streptomyces]|uniref:carboxymuconolactone decarboxylase family protein n=1 Tax=unclassified Streptomyces TaxID=2593676 RepID=UPI002253FBE0|nr:MULTISPECIES: carboxymuconolactone decarboxylase family protein [unclassified Streptomyces]WSP58661.1 carboxymuconolactone decarboxylase family protein [Streptomyces sp. NBC_01241]WSU20761.1 carboxymuconolactone decarboxylase family protein [Streptomyces sp. NBC_01108]MCX4790440.1 carboxymuconolactone decarboxylase family protein [Streptomyces sp. NBC_01221]MCX4793834.1 carboxymuconolactone decarboxylase family protein [Streptomyces sp. NBC_01242]WSJ35251.1 carboxymuconolactone decarboxylas
MTGPFRYTSPVPPKSATGTVADVYAQLGTDFGIDRARVFVVLSAAPPLLAGTWAVLRESLLAGRAPRTDKEVVAAGVSLANRCPFCVDAHIMLLHATGDHRLAETLARGEQPKDPWHRQLLAWGQDMSTARPFPAEQAAEHIGTALAFHFINRIVSSLLTENALPGGAQKYRLVRTVAGRSLAGTVRRELTPGESLALLETEGEPPRWAAGTAIGTAFGALRTAARLGAGLLSDEELTLVRESVAAWDGVTPLPLHGARLPDRDALPGARLALLAARAPYRITDDDVAAWRVPPRTDHCLVHLIAFGAICAVERVEAVLTTTTKEHA